jgi:N-acetyl sugar amidotransferase
MQVRDYKICSRCVMDTTDLEISFDDRVFCNHCREFLSQRSKYIYQGAESERALDHLIEKIKLAGRNRRYDCIIGVSGGVDSSYTAYIAKQKGLRILAVHMDNGWDSKEAVTNINNVVKKLEIDYESYVLNWEEVKDLQLAFLKAAVPEVETPTDTAIIEACHHFAAKYDVKYIISGGNLATEGILPRSWHYDARDLKYFDYIHKTFGKKRLKHFLAFGLKRELYYKLVKQVRMVYPLNYIPYDNQQVMRLLEEKLDWKYYGGKHYESTFTRFIQSYYLYEKFGIDYRRAGLSTQICLGDIDRRTALDRLKNKPYDPAKIEVEKQYVAKKLGVFPDDFDEILNLPAKWFWDYPNDNKRLRLIYNDYRKLFTKEKLASF